ncbi:phage tail protein [Necropsobacter rosorum]|uniref:phage tail protein n=1 Tax=Necropsobacter rosorum TaxID=908285 RepID=UPI000509980B
MKKPNQIRKIIEQSYPDFEANPDRLQLYIDNGQIIATGAGGLSFEYRYTLNIIATDFKDDLAQLIVPIEAYLRTNQPEIFENPQKREGVFKFVMDYNNNDTVDVSFEIQMTERVVTTKTDNLNEIKLQYAPEPVWNQERVRVYLETEDNLIFDSGVMDHGNR